MKKAISLILAMALCLSSSLAVLASGQANELQVRYILVDNIGNWEDQDLLKEAEDSMFTALAQNGTFSIVLQNPSGQNHEFKSNNGYVSENWTGYVTESTYRPGAYTYKIKAADSDPAYDMFAQFFSQAGQFKIISVPLPEGFELYADIFTRQSPHAEGQIINVDIKLMKSDAVSVPEAEPIIESPVTVTPPAPKPVNEPAKDINVATNIKLAVSGEVANLTLPILNVNGRTMYPFRECLGLIGAEVEWIAEERMAIGFLDGNTVQFELDSNFYWINGEEAQMEEGLTAFIYESRTYIPLRYAAEALGYKVQWDAATNTITLNKN